MGGLSAKKKNSNNVATESPMALKFQNIKLKFGKKKRIENVFTLFASIGNFFRSSFQN